MGADEIANAGGLAEQVDHLIVVFDFDHQVTRIELPLLRLGHPLAVLVHLDLGHFLDRDHDLAERLFEVFLADAALDGFLDRILAPALDLDDVPVFRILGRGFFGGGRRLFVVGDGGGGVVFRHFGVFGLVDIGGGVGEDIGFRHGVRPALHDGPALRLVGRRVRRIHGFRRVIWLEHGKISGLRCRPGRVHQRCCSLVLFFSPVSLGM